MKKTLASFVLILFIIHSSFSEVQNKNGTLVHHDRNHVILCFDANGNQGKIDITSKKGREKFNQVLDTLFNKLTKPDFIPSNRPIFDSTGNDLASMVYYFPRMPESGVKNFGFMQDFILLNEGNKYFALNKLPKVADFATLYSQLLTVHKRPDALNLFQEAPAAAILFLADSSYQSVLKPVDNIYLVNFYTENINISQVNNNLESFLRSTWIDTADSKGATNLRNLLNQQLSPIKNDLIEIGHQVFDHVNGLKLHFKIFEYQPKLPIKKDFLRNPFQDLELKLTDKDSFYSKINIKNCLNYPLPDDFKIEYWTLEIVDTLKNISLAKNIGFYDDYKYAFLTGFTKNILNNKNIIGKLQITAFSLLPISLKIRVNSNIIELKVGFPNWMERNLSWILPLLILIITGFIIRYIYIYHQINKKVTEIGLYFEEIDVKGLKIDFNINEPGWKTIAKLRVNNESNYNKYQIDAGKNYEIKVGEIRLDYKVQIGRDTIQLVAKNNQQPILGFETSSNGKSILVNKIPGFTLEARKEISPGPSQQTGKMLFDIGFQSNNIADIRNCFKFTPEVNAELIVTAECSELNGMIKIKNTEYKIPITFIRENAYLDYKLENLQSEISFNDSEPQHVCDLVVLIAQDKTKEFSLPFSGTFIFDKKGYSDQKFPFEMREENLDLRENFILHELKRDETKKISLYVNLGIGSIESPQSERDIFPKTIRLLADMDSISGLSKSQVRDLTNEGIEIPIKIFPDKRKLYLSAEIQEIKPYKFDTSLETSASDDFGDFIKHKSSKFHTLVVEFDPTMMDIQKPLWLEPIADLNIYSHRSGKNIGEIGKIKIEFKKEIHGKLLKLKCLDSPEDAILPIDVTSYTVTDHLIPKGENKKLSLRLFIDWTEFRDALRANALAPTYQLKHFGEEIEKISLYPPDSNVIEFNGIPYDDLDMSIVIELEKPSKTPLHWWIDWKFKLIPCKNQFWISIDYGTSAIAAACWNGREGYENIIELNLFNSWIKQELDSRSRMPEIERFLPSRTRILKENILGSSGFVEFINPWLADIRMMDVLPPLKIIINEPRVNLKKAIEYTFFDTSVKSTTGLPKTELVLRSMYFNLIEHYIVPCLNDYMYQYVYNPRIEKLRDENDRSFVSLKEYLARFIITIPNSFSFWHKKKISYQLKEICKEYKLLSEEHTRFEFLSESESVAYYYLMNRRKRQKKFELTEIKKNNNEEYILIYDQGAGTLDLSYIKFTNIFSSGGTEENRTKIEILSQVGMYAAGNNINYQLAKTIEDTITNKDLKLDIDGLDFKPNRSLVPAIDASNNEINNYNKDNDSYYDHLVLFHRDLEYNYKRNISTNRKIKIDDIAGIYDSIFDNKKENKTIIYEIGSEEVRKKFYSDVSDQNKLAIQNLAQRMTSVILAALFELSLLPTQIREKGKIPLDRIIFSGRSSIFLGIQEEVCSALKNWTKSNFDVLALESSEEAKLAVAKGSVIYAIEVLDKKHTVKSDRIPLFVRYVVIDSEAGALKFKELLSPHSLNYTQKININLIYGTEVVLYQTLKDVEELNKMSFEEALYWITEVCRVPCDLTEKREVEVILTVRSSGELLFSVNGRQPADEFLYPPPIKEPGYVEGQWPFIFMQDDSSEKKTDKKDLRNNKESTNENKKENNHYKKLKSKLNQEVNPDEIII